MIPRTTAIHTNEFAKMSRRTMIKRLAAGGAAASLQGRSASAAMANSEIALPKPHEVQTNGIRMAVYEQGNGIPVVLCH